MTNQLILKVKEVKTGSFWSMRGYIIVNPVLKDDFYVNDSDYLGQDLGDYIITSKDCDAAKQLRKIREYYREKGYAILGDWDF